MRTTGAFLFFSICFLLSARADLTIVQKIEGPGPASEMTMKIKGDKSRVDMTPQLTTIFDSKTGEMIELMKDQKAVVRMSGKKIKAMADTMKKDSAKAQSTERPRLTATGKKEMVNGYEAEEYATENPTFKASYWIAPKYPDGAAILKQLQSINAAVWDPGNFGIPNFDNLPGLPIKTVISMGGTQIISTLVSIKQDPISDTEFAVPKDFKKVPMPSMLHEGGKPPALSASPQP